MSAEHIFIVVSGAVAALLGIGALVSLVRARPAEGDEEIDQRPAPRALIYEKYDRPSLNERGVHVPYGTAVRVLWWVSIASVLVGVGLTDAFDTTQSGIFVLGAAAVVVVVVLHDLLPSDWQGGVASFAEVVAALVLESTLLILTGYGGSPFVYGYHLVAVAVALALGGRVALGAASAGSLAYLAVLAMDPALPTYGPPDFLRFGLTIVSIWLLAYLAGVFASAERRIRAGVLELSQTDGLTGLYNRGQLFPTLEQEVQRTRRSERGFCLLMVDLDGLKAVNDSYGHHRGDEVLRMLGAVIRRSIRLVDTAYRYGGDEFLVLLPETDFAGAFVVAEKIRAGAEEVGLVAGGGELLTSVSVGLVSCPEDGTSAEELMIAVDRAMYQAKSLGKNQISGNPRPRRLVMHEEVVRGEVPPSLPVEPAVAQPEPGSGTAEPVEATAEPTVPMAERDASTPVPGVATAEAAAFTIESGEEAVAEPALSPEPAPVPEPAAVAAGQATAAGRPETNGVTDAGEEEEPDPTEVRRHIAAARRNLDPDHQIRRAMDAFLSPTRRPEGD